MSMSKERREELEAEWEAKCKALSTAELAGQVAGCAGDMPTIDGHAVLAEAAVRLVRLIAYEGA